MILHKNHKAAFWIMFVWMTFGLILEGLHGLKLHSYLGDAIRRDMWRLAHTHGVLFSLVFVAFSHFHGYSRPQLEKLGFIGLILLPLGFFLGGIATTETDPWIGILLAPPGGLCFILAIGLSLKAEPPAVPSEAKKKKKA